MNNWQAENLRLTTFHRASSINLQSPDWWQRVTSSEPDQQISRPRDALVQQSGRFAGHQLMANARPDRVDWILHSVPDPTSSSLSTEPILGPMSQAFGSFQTVYDAWLKKSEPIIRLAFGAVLLQNVANLRMAYEKLDILLPAVDLKDVYTPDFLYQINRPEESTVVNGLRINKISKWSVAQSGSIAIALGSGGPIDVSMSPVGIACRLELDINTAAESTREFDTSEAHQLFDELLSFVDAIASKGDV